MSNAGTRALVPPIIGRPSPHGLLGGCIEVVTTSDPHELNGTDTRPTSCAQTHPWQNCPAGQPTDEFPWANPTSKTFDRMGWCTFEPVTAYAGVSCSTLGTTAEEMRQAALSSLALGEQRTVEDWFYSRWLANGSHTVDLSPAPDPDGTFLHFANGLALLEGWLAENYGGAGVLHIPASAAALMSLHGLVDIASEEGCPTTLMGNSVVLGAGYSANLGPAVPPAPPVAAEEGSVWLYITPPMRIRRSAPEVYSLTGQGVRTDVNDRYALAESTFVPEVACCMAAAVLVSLSACC